MNTPRVSIVVTTYNRVDLLCQAVDSALDQDFPESQREIILIDDGSTDGTREVVESRYGDRIRYVHKSNGGFVSACALGFSMARGEIIAQLDSDDTWSRDKLSKTVPKFDEAADVVAVFHDLDIVKADGRTACETLWTGSHARLGEAPCDALGPYLAGYPLPSWTSASLWRRSALELILPMPEGLEGYVERALLTGRSAAARWILKNELALPSLVQLHLFAQLWLPGRLAAFLKNRVIGRFVPLN